MEKQRDFRAMFYATEADRQRLLTENKELKEQADELYLKYEECRDHYNALKAELNRMKKERVSALRDTREVRQEHGERVWWRSQEPVAPTPTSRHLKLMQDRIHNSLEDSDTLAEAMQKMQFRK